MPAAAVLPGNRNFLPLRSPGRNTPAFLEKSHAVRALRAAARRDHVLAATVRFGRRRVKVKVRVVAADSEAEREILERVEAAVRERFDSFGLVRPTKLVLRAKSFRPPAPKPRPGAVPLHSIEPGHAPGDDTATGPDTTPDIDTAGSDAKSETSPAALAGSSPEVGSSDGRKTRVIE